MVKKTIVSNHALIPKHTKLSQKQKDDLLKKYNIAETQLPKIYVTDAAIMDLGVKLGDVVQIERNTRTSGKSYFYRVVVSGK